jgi:hypothetical protein
MGISAALMMSIPRRVWRGNRSCSYHRVFAPNERRLGQLWLQRRRDQSTGLSRARRAPGHHSPDPRGTGDNPAMAVPPPSNQPDHEVLAGIVERVTFHNAETGFCVLRVKARGHRDLATIAASMMSNTFSPKALTIFLA